MGRIERLRMIAQLYYNNRNIQDEVKALWGRSNLEFLEDIIIPAEIYKATTGGKSLSRVSQEIIDLLKRFCDEMIKNDPIDEKVKT
ncbi:MAG: hypothetical protein JXD23_01345 [Spirochaetales bacterium]|nr:hypothetical protein [Spirochaetales bacterium]